MHKSKTNNKIATKYLGLDQWGLGQLFTKMFKKLSFFYLLLTMAFLCFAVTLQAQDRSILKIQAPRIKGLIVHAVGDVQIGRGVARRYPNGFSLPQLQNFFRKGAINFGNLEGCLLEENPSPTSNSGIGTKTEVPIVLGFSAKQLQSLKLLGFNIFSLANNHCGDAGMESITKTLQLLSSSEIHAVGASTIGGDPRKPLEFTVDGQTLSFLAATQFLSPLLSEKDRNTIHTINKEYLVRALATERRHHPERAILVSLHWGAENTEIISDQQKLLAHALIDAGATVVIGHHPHVVQEIESYHNGLIAYSLGNFIFDQERAPQRNSLLLEIELHGPQIHRVYLLPLTLQRFLPQLLRTNIKGKQPSNDNLLAKKIEIINNGSKPNWPIKILQ